MAEEKKTTTKKATAAKTTTKSTSSTKTTAAKTAAAKSTKTVEKKPAASVEKTTKVAKKQTKTIRVTLIKSYIGYNKDQARTVKALGLNKMNSSNELVDNPCVRGMINKVKHLVRMEEIN